MTTTAEDDALATQIDLFRHSLDLFIDGEGRWFIEGDPVTHPRIQTLLNRGLDLLDSGEPVMRVGARWCYVRADDTPFIVGAFRLEPDGLWVVLNTGERLRVPDDAFELGDPHVYVCLSPQRRARLSRTAQASLAPWLVEDDAGLKLVNSAGRWSLPAIG